MHHPQRKGLVAAASLAALLALAACGERPATDTAAGSSDSSTTTASSAPATTGSESAPVARAPKATSDDAGSSAVASSEGNSASSASDTSVMGAAGSAAATKVDDVQITTKVNAGLAADKDLSAIKIDVDTKEGVVTLSGPVPSAAAKARASEIAKNVKDVKSVNNQLTVSAS
jgi:hyperosmotically inducible periplasmic protein